MAKLQTFNGGAEKVLGFLMVYRLYIRMRIRNNMIGEQIQWVLSYVQGGSADIWKKNIMEDLESRILSHAIIREFLADLKQEFGGENNKTMKIVSQMRYSLVVILELNSVSEVQYKDMMTDR